MLVSCRHYHLTKQHAVPVSAYTNKHLNARFLNSSLPAGLKQRFRNFRSICQRMHQDVHLAIGKANLSAECPEGHIFHVFHAAAALRLKHLAKILLNSFHALFNGVSFHTCIALAFTQLNHEGVVGPSHIARLYSALRECTASFISLSFLIHRS